jgi:hypothetical protein
MALLLSTYKYAVDTCSFTQLGRSYPFEIFPGVWEKIEKMISDGLICSIDEVYFEIVDQDDILSGWAKKRHHIFLPIDEDVQQNATNVLQTHSNLLDLRKNKSGADPFLIAAAMVHKCAVVTEEKPSGGPDRSKIPDVCKAYGIECIRVLEMLKREGLRL